MTIETWLNIIKDNFPNLKISFKYGLGYVHYYIDDKEIWMEEKDNYNLIFEVKNNELYLIGEYVKIHDWENDDEYNCHFNIKIKNEFIIELIQHWFVNIHECYDHERYFYYYLKNNNLIEKFAGNI